MRLAIAGLGLVGKRHADAIKQVEDAILCAVVDPSEAGREEAERLGVACFSDLQSLIDQGRPDGIILSTPTKLHVSQGIDCIEAGIPVMIEKPLADDVRNGAAIVAKSEAAGIPVLVGHHRRHNPIIQKAKSVIQDGLIGDVRAAQATCWFYKPDEYFDIAPWRKRKGAGPISVNLVHDVDLIRYLCGEVVTVQAQAGPSRRGFENEDVAAAVLTFDTGAIGTITVSDSIVSPWSWEMTAGEYPVYPATTQSCYQIGGSHGSLSIPDMQLWSHGEVRDWWAPISATSAPRDASDPLVNQMDHFVAVIKDGASPLVSAREGLRSLAVVEAIQSAAQTGDIIRLDTEATAPAGTSGGTPDQDRAIRPIHETNPNTA